MTIISQEDFLEVFNNKKYWTIYELIYHFNLIEEDITISLKRFLAKASKLNNYNIKIFGKPLIKLHRIDPNKKTSKVIAYEKL